jgi:microcystin-dependent protein
MQPFIGEIRLFAGSYTPASWAICDGQLLPISEFTDLFELIGTTYGGDGENTFALPDLRSRIPIHQGNGFDLGQSGGQETVQLGLNQVPGQNHGLTATTARADQSGPAGNILAQTTGTSLYLMGDPNATLAPSAVGVAPGGEAHPNIQPYVALNFIIALYGTFPTTG